MSPPPTPRVNIDKAAQPLVAEMLLKLGQVTERLEPNDADTKRWKAATARNRVVTGPLHDLTQAQFLDG